MRDVQEYMHDLRRQSDLFDTEKIDSAHVAVIGSGPISNFLCAYLTGLGVGNITLVDNTFRKRSEASEFMIRLSNRRGLRQEKIGDISRKINPKIRFKTYFSMPDKHFLQGCDVVVDTTNDPISKYLTFRHSGMTNLGKTSEMLYISCSSSRESSSVTTYDWAKKQEMQNINLDDITMISFRDLDQGSAPSGLIAAIAADEIRKKICPVDNDRKLQTTLSYSAGQEVRFFDRGFRKGEVQDISMEDRSNIKHKKALVVGAGGIGTYVLLHLAAMGFDIDIYDHDEVAAHNLNRQIIHFGGVGNNKAEEAVRKLRVINPDIIVRAFPQKVTYDVLERKRKAGDHYDAVYSCVDSWNARRMLNNYARLTQTPLFNGGVSTFSAKTEQFIPGKTHCLECRTDYLSRERVEKAKEQANGGQGRISCPDLPSNVVMPNAIAGALMVAESINMFIGSLDTAINKSAVFESNGVEGERLFLDKASKFCTNPHYYAHRCRCHNYMDLGGAE